VRCHSGLDPESAGNLAKAKLLQSNYRMCQLGIEIVTIDILERRFRVKPGMTYQEDIFHMENRNDKQ